MNRLSERLSSRQTARGSLRLALQVVAIVTCVLPGLVSCKNASRGNSTQPNAEAKPYDRSREGSRPAGLDPRRDDAADAVTAIEENVETAEDRALAAKRALSDRSATAADPNELPEVDAAKSTVDAAKDTVDRTAKGAVDAATDAVDAATGSGQEAARGADALVTSNVDAAGSVDAAGAGTSSAAKAAVDASAAAADASATAGGRVWPMWGGAPGRNMVNTVETGIASSWDVSSGKNIKYKVQLGSQSYGNPVIYGGKVFVGTNNGAEFNPEIKGDKGILMCIRQSDGEVLWQAVHDKLSQGRVNDWPEQGICSSPVCEPGRIYYVSNRCELVCADMEGFRDGENDGPFVDEKYKSEIDGDFIWTLDMLNDLGVFPHNLATSSPVIVGDLIYIVTSNGVERDHITIPNPRAPSFLAVDKNSGEVVWHRRDPGKNILHGQWSCAAVGKGGDRDMVVFPGGDGWLYSFEPLTGNPIWKFDLNPKDSVWQLGGLGTRNNVIATPVFVDGIVYLAVGQDPEHGEGIGHLYAINADGEGDITGKNALWHYGDDDFRRTISTCAVLDGVVYAVDLSGFVHCLDQTTGKPFWVHDMLAAVWGSPTVIDGKVYLGDEDGDLVVLRHRKRDELLAASAAGKKIEPELIAEMNMGSSVYTGPVAVDGVLYIASRTHLFAIAESK